MLAGIQAIGIGLGRALRSPLILVALWLIGLAASVPATWILVNGIEDSIGASRFHESMTSGFDATWYEEYGASAKGLNETFDPSLVGAGAFFDNLERWLTGSLFTANPALLVTAGVFALIWLFLLGGVIDRYAQPGRLLDFSRFFRACGLYFVRFVRLTALSAVLYYLVYRLLRVTLERIETLTQESTTESTVIAYCLLAWGFVALLLTLIHLCFGFARVAIVIEERKSVLLGSVRGFGFVLFHPGKAITLYYGMLLLSGLLLGVYALIAPGSAQATPRTILVAFLIAQCFLLARLLLRLGLIAGEVALFRANVVLPQPASAVADRDAQTPSALAAES